MNKITKFAFTVGHRLMSQPQPIRGFLDLFSSVWLGVTLLFLLFLYCSVGSAGILYPDLARSLNVFDLDNWNQIVPRQHFSLLGLDVRLEKTEYEWFIWWPFNTLIALICLNLVTATLRRIPFKVINLGVWMIHTGIIILAIGSVWYFSTKVEGDAPVFRRRIAITVPGSAEPYSIVAMTGNRLTANTASGVYQFQVVDVDPAWELLTGDDAGKAAYSVMVRISTPEKTFIRQLISGCPEYTEDVIPGEGRAIKLTGERLLDPSIDLALDYVPQEWFYLVQSDALYVREVGEEEWAERPIDHLPRYSEYLTSRDEAWLPPGMSRIGERPLGIAVPPASEDDPIGGMTLRIASYLRYALPQTRLDRGTVRLDPYVRVRIESSASEPETIQLRAFDPSVNDVDPEVAQFDWIEEERELEPLRRSSAGRLSVSIPALGYEESIDTNELSRGVPEFRELGESGYAIRVREFLDRMEPSPGEQQVSLAIIDIRTPEREFNRWVFDQPRLNRDQIANPETGALEMVDLDESIEIDYKPGRLVPLLHFVAGPHDDDLRVILNTTPGAEGQVFALREQETTQVLPFLSLHVEDYWPRTRDVVKPQVIPPSQRDRNLDMRFRMIRVELPGQDEPVSVWLRFHDYPFQSADAAMRGFAYEPTTVMISDGTRTREVEMVYSRRRMPLPARVVLEDFEVDWHVGGFTGENISVRNWHSNLRFASEAGGTWGPVETVAVNEPAEHGGYWYFQKMWDPPDPATAQQGGARWNGLNYTVLGVGNRNGVLVQLLGCTIAVMGMIYAFYVKPLVKRRRQDRVYAAVEASHDDAIPNQAVLARPNGTPAVDGVTGRVATHDQSKAGRS